MVSYFKNCTKQGFLWFDFFQEEEKINKISVESRVRKDRESHCALCYLPNITSQKYFSCVSNISISYLSYILLFLSVPWAEEGLLVYVQPGAVPGILLDLCQHDRSTLHSWSRFVEEYVYVRVNQLPRSTGSLPNHF